MAVWILIVVLVSIGVTLLLARLLSGLNAPKRPDRRDGSDGVMYAGAGSSDRGRADHDNDGPGDGGGADGGGD